MRRTTNLFLSGSIFALLFLIAGAGSIHAQGIATLTGIGPVNRSMGGAGTAAPLDAIGALHWNPASISGLQSNEVSFGIELLYPVIDLQSNLGVDQRSDGGITPIPSIGWVHHIEDSSTTIGLGIYGVGGFKNNQPANALLGGSSGFASAEILQIAPTVAFALNENLSVGLSPTITTTTAILDPLGPSVVTPVPTPGQGNRTHWGVGVQAGVYYISDNKVHVGFSYKSTQWTEDLEFLTPGGKLIFDLDYPAIMSLGVAYSGIPNWTFAADGRYLDYDNTDGWAQLGYESVVAGAIGIEYAPSECLKFRMGYNVNENPLGPEDAQANIISPLIEDQNIAVGATIRLVGNVDMNFAYVHLLENTLTGPLSTPPFPPGATVTHQLSAHSLIAGLKVAY